MSDGARLRALRLVGFKSFAERTNIEFGPGISAIVGPNGSGKSNLADALRWTLGEQGRSLRTRRSEDVIFAGSSSRRAIGMADVTLVIENSDRLLPLDYSEIEISRRLYRSGENEYLLNRQRVRLRDLVDVLDAGNLADNAFLFIGQGMVDQALALRPEERRPLFEEAAGVRRHERRRRQAEAELAEAEANLERLRDLLDELRPQARRLAAQAEQLQARRTAGLELADALVAVARVRWAATHRTAAEQQATLEAAHSEADAELSALRRAEETVERHSAALAERAQAEHERRLELDARRARTFELRLELTRVQSDMQAAERERVRLGGELAALESRMRGARRALAQPPAIEDAGPRRRLREAEVELEDLRRQLAALGSEARHNGADSVAARRNALAARLDEQRRSLGRLEQSASDSRSAADVARFAQQQAEHELEDAVRRVAATVQAEQQAESVAAQARLELEASLQGRADIARRLAEADAIGAAARARLAESETAIAAHEDRALARAARASGATRLAEGLEVEAPLRRAVSAALGQTIRAMAVSESAVSQLQQGRGVLFLREASERTAQLNLDRAGQSLVAAAVQAGGDSLVAAVRRDPQGYVARLLARTVWVPELAQALALRRSLPAGWRIVTLAGELVTDEGLVKLAEPEAVLEQRAAYAEQRRRSEELAAHLSGLREELNDADTARERAAQQLDDARRRQDDARRARREAEEAQRAAERRAESSVRETLWHTAQLERIEREASALRSSVAELEAELSALGAEGSASPRALDAETQLRARLDVVSRRHERLAAEVAAADAELRRALSERQRADVALALDETRMAEIEAGLERVAGEAQDLSAQNEQLSVALGIAQEHERLAQAELEALLGQDVRDRSELQRAERQAGEARERLRRAEARSRTAEVALMEARLQLEQVGEQLLVELAAIGPDGLAALAEPEDDQPVGDRAAAVPAPPPGSDASSASGDGTSERLGSELEHALRAAIATWQTQHPLGDAPSNARVGLLRRRFHELGAGNPFAVEEYEQLRGRLGALEAQRADLEAAMAKTRELIGNLSRLITDQFRSTFQALEGAFARRFEQLFAGGDAQLTLTQPDDLSATGVEITARPPGKKRQPLGMLSGGERALTAVALLLAMLEVRPVPFCVLDEVDAALDEANVARFSAALRGLADQTQFIVITHNRGTIEAADALYGVTLGDDAVSRIVSLRLPPAGELRPHAVIRVELTRHAEAPRG